MADLDHLLAVLLKTTGVDKVGAYGKDSSGSLNSRLVICRVELGPADGEMQYERLNVHCNKHLPNKSDAALELLKRVRKIVGEEAVAAAEAAVHAAQPSPAAGPSAPPNVLDELGKRYRLEHKEKAAQLCVDEAARVLERKRAQHAAELEELRAQQKEAAAQLEESLEAEEATAAEIAAELAPLLAKRQCTRPAPEPAPKPQPATPPRPEWEGREYAKYNTVLRSCLHFSWTTPMLGESRETLECAYVRKCELDRQFRSAGAPAPAPPGPSPGRARMSEKSKDQHLLAPRERGWSLTHIHIHQSVD